MGLSKLNELIIFCHGKGYRVTKDGEITGVRGNKLSTTLSQKGYRRITVRTPENKTTSLKVHRLQAFQKYGDKMFEEGIMVTHKDGNRQNNSWDNIKLGTQSDIIMALPEEQRKAKASNPKHDHKGILADREAGMSYKQLMAKYDIKSKGTLSFIINTSSQKVA